MQRIAIIDVGSNSARLVISHIYKNGAYLMAYNQKESLRLSQKVNAENLLTEEAFACTLETMKSFLHMCKLYQVDKIIAVATAAIRNADNGQELIDRVAQETGINLHIISGNTEAYISFLGVINTLDVKDGIMFDLGGGSTELILFRNRQVVKSVSLPFGAVNTTAMFNTRNDMKGNTYTELAFFLKSRLAEYAWLKQPELPLIGVGGTARTVAKIIQRAKKYPSTRLHNYSYPVQVFRKFFANICKTDFEERKKISGLSTERNDIILAGCSIISCLVDATEAKEMITSGCGLREGLFYDYYYRSKDMPVVAKDILEQSRENSLKLYAADIQHAQHVNSLTLAMFDGWQKLHHLKEDSRRLLETAALLHDVGIGINYYSHARHSAYMLQNAKLFGLSHKEQLIVAAIAGWHHGAAKKYFQDDFYKTLLDERDWQKINKLALLLALGEALDYTQTLQVQRIEALLEKKQPLLRIFAEEAPTLELHEVENLGSWFRKAFNVEMETAFVQEGLRTPDKE